MAPLLLLLLLPRERCRCCGSRDCGALPSSSCSSWEAGCDPEGHPDACRPVPDRGPFREEPALAPLVELAQEEGPLEAVLLAGK